MSKKDFSIIRIGSCYELVIAISPANALPEDKDTKFYRYITWQPDNESKPYEFQEVSRTRALSYFAGIADGIGFEPTPEEIFPSLDKMTRFVKKKNRELRKAFLEKLK